MAVKITSVAKQLPKYYRETKDIIPFVKLWMQDQDTRFQRKVIKLFAGAAVDKRYSIIDPEEVFTATSFEEKNNIYKREVTQLAEKSLQKSLDKANLKATDIDYIIKTLSLTVLREETRVSWVTTWFVVRKSVPFCIVGGPGRGW